jgi:hypothetical protein
MPMPQATRPQARAAVEEDAEADVEPKVAPPAKPAQPAEKSEPAADKAQGDTEVPN